MASTRIKGKLRGLSLTLDGKQVISFAVEGDWRELCEELRDKELTVELSEYKQKRSKNANAFMWELCGKLSEKLNMPDVQVYREAIRQVGVHKDIEIKGEDAAKTLTYMWEWHGLGWFVETLDYTEDGEGVVKRFYYGSSSYNTAQMARLINELVEDCRALGIECGSEQERSLLIDKWKPEVKKND